MNKSENLRFLILRAAVTVLVVLAVLLTLRFSGFLSEGEEIHPQAAAQSVAEK